MSQQPSARRQETATLLHALFCTWNHTDGCGWYYKEEDWTEYSHAKYLAVADDLLMRFNDSQSTFLLVLKWLKRKREDGEF